MKIYVGKYEYLPQEWEGYNGLVEKSEAEIMAEVQRQIGIDEDDDLIGVYEKKEFEATINGLLNPDLRVCNYWVRIYD